MINTTVEALIRTAQQKKISKWKVTECAVCDYPIVFKIISATEVYYDETCHCSDETARSKYVKSSWEDILNTILGLTDLEQIKQTKEFWNIK